jgi:AcrR family transcriptional regulator
MDGGAARRSASLPWWPETRERPAAREPVTLERIIAASIRIADAEGLDALSMRRLAKELDVATTSLYWHVKSKDQLLDLVLDHLIGEIPFEREVAGTWRDRMTFLAASLRAVLAAHPGAGVVMGQRNALGPNMLYGIDIVIGVLRDAGFTGLRLAVAYQALLNFVSGFSVMETRGLGAVAQRGASEVEAISGSMDLLASLPPALYPNLPSIIPHAAEATFDAQFEYGLAMLLDGMERDVERHDEAAQSAEAEARGRAT